MKTDEAEALIRRFVDAYNRLDIDAMCALVSADFHYRSDGQFAIETAGIDEFRQFSEKFKPVFAERRHTITAIGLGKNGPIVDSAFQGRLAIALPRGPAAGTIMQWTSCTAVCCKDGKIVSIAERN